MAGSENTRPFSKPSIPNAWDVEKLVDCCLIKGEYGLNAGAVEYSESLPTYLRITDIDDDGYYSEEKKVSVNDKHSANYVLSKGDIVFARTGATVGKTYLYDERDGNLVFAGFLIRFRSDSARLLPEYLRYFTDTKTYWDWVKTVSMRSGQPGINAEEYGSLKIPLPPLAEQKAIAHVLGLVDKAIELNNKIIAQKELRKKWLMQNLLTGKKRLKGFTGEWQEAPLSQIGEFSKGSGIAKEDVTETGLPCVRYGEIYTRHNVIIQDFASFVSEAVAKGSKEINKGDILFAGSGETLEEIGKSVAYLGEEVAYAGGDIIILSTSDAVSAEYIAYFLESDFFQRQKRRYGQGQSVVHIYRSDLARLTVMLPNQKEQMVIAKVFLVADEEIRTLRKRSDTLRSLKKGLMQQLLTGKKRLKID
ncbi:MAG: restriction endonuclease subunit S [Acidobacteria bacterium]|nr:restriction endonuclease subunit S [Acidobacteriota bacterium]